MIQCFLGLKWSEWSSWETRSGKRWRTRKEEHVSSGKSSGDALNIRSPPRTAAASLSGNSQGLEGGGSSGDSLNFRAAHRTVSLARSSPALGAEARSEGNIMFIPVFSKCSFACEVRQKKFDMGGAMA